ncbi:MAG: FtsX-like permease family protein [Candidatus Marinimicrobia bacterium]|nr:FtsX-like permease family protein [Candidatus Neomarinimicrobiota bacterium]
MLNHFLTIFIRNILKHPWHYFLTVGGLILGFTATFAIALFIQQEFRFDRFHDHAEDIYRLSRRTVQQGQTTESAMVTPMSAIDLQREFPVIQKVVRLRKTRGVMRLGDELYREEQLLYADSTFFDIFSFHILQGEAGQLLSLPNSLVLTRSISRKLFGSDNPLGRSIQYQSDFQNQPLEFTITGIVADPPGHSHFDFDAIISIVSLDSKALQSYSHTTYYAYLLLHPDASWRDLESQFDRYISQKAGPHVAERLSFQLQPLTDIYLRSNKVAEIGPSGSITHILILISIGLFLILISMMNFINLTTARASSRIREVGIRKILGAHRHGLIGQLLSETLVLAIAAGVASLVMLEIIAPFLNSLAGKNLGIWNTGSWMFSLSLLLASLFTGALAGILPALMLSGYRPVQALYPKGDISKGGSTFRSILVVVQFTLSIILIIGAMVSIRQLEYVQSKGPGFARDQLLVLPNQLNRPDTQTLLNWKSRLMQTPAVQSVTATSSVLGNDLEQNSFIPEGYQEQDARTFRVLFVDANFTETYGLTLRSGRDFSPEKQTDQQTFLLNQAAVKALGWNNPIGKSLNHIFYKVKGPIIGVVEDFHYTSLHQQIEPLVLSFQPWRLSAITIRLLPRNMRSTLRQIQSICQELNPAQPFRYTFLDQEFARLYEQDRRLSKLVRVFALIAIGIACLGLYGLSAYSTEHRTSEIGVRKVLGATVVQVTILLSSEYLRLVGLAFLLGAPAGYVIMRWWLQQFAYQINITPLMILIAGLLAATIALLTVSYHAIRSAVANPTDSLRYE